jgi:hypothetical protein
LVDIRILAWFIADRNAVAIEPRFQELFQFQHRDWQRWGEQHGVDVDAVAGLDHVTLGQQFPYSILGHGFGISGGFSRGDHTCPHGMHV